ncbi:MAG TPA: EAL domain-containing protein [Sphingomicrobium sp.]|nr:EAL domain-containing protein [Sphingomicrobium sp.]
MLAAFVLSAASVAMLGATHYYWSIKVDNAARDHGERVVTNGLQRFSEEIGKSGVDQTYWDEAVLYGSNKIDLKWVNNAFGRVFWEIDGFEGSILFDYRDAVVYAHARGHDEQPEHYRTVIQAAKPLIASIRDRERKRGRVDVSKLVRGSQLEPITAHGVIRDEDAIFFLGASLVQPDSKAVPADRPASILVILERMDQAVVNQISSRFLLERPVLRLGSVKPSKGRGQAVMRDPSGQPIAALEFDVPTPGAELSKRLWPALALFAAGLLAATMWIIRRGRSMAGSLVASEARATHLAFHDQLTGLPNRARLNEGFAQLASQARRTGEQFAVMCIDLDLFKAVNDNFGHMAGDELIRIVAATIQRKCGPHDFLARIGGDEFILLQADSSAERASELAGEVIAAIAEPVELKVGRAFIGASIGLVMVGDSPIDAQEALRRADLAMYAAKQAGRNGYAFFDSSFDRAVRHRMTMQTHLHDALANGALELVYQPQVNFSGSVIGVEALARWESPELGLVPPAAFVQVAEETGLIEALGMFTIRRAFEDSRRWPGLRVAINVSAVQLRTGDFVDRLAALAQEVGVDPQRFELEITERVLLGDDPATLTGLNRLRALGFRIVLDDFGTGYSSLGYLQRYPIDKVKIDRTFVARVGVERQAEEVVVAIVRLASALGMEVLAEGVETEAQRICLNVAGCSDFQGYLTGMPVPAGEIDKLVSDISENRRRA